MSEHLGIRFRDGEAFPADDPLARWLTVCAMALNDLLLVNRWLMPRLQEQIEAPDYENVYLGRLAGAHLFEVAKFLEVSDRKMPAVRDFVGRLDADAQAAYEQVKSVGPRSGSEFAQQLKRARNQFFHYSELLPQAEDHEKLRAAIDAHAETTGEIRDEGTAIEGFRASFADDIAVELSFPEDEVDLPAFVEQVAERIAAFVTFAFAALPEHVKSLPSEAWEYIDRE